MKPHNPDDYLRKAEECLAASMRPGLSPAESQHLRDMAVCWFQLATDKKIPPVQTDNPELLKRWIKDARLEE